MTKNRHAMLPKGSDQDEFRELLGAAKIAMTLLKAQSKSAIRAAEFFSENCPNPSANLELFRRISIESMVYLFAGW